MAIRLRKIARILNIGLSDAIKLFQERGINLSNDPNILISEKDFYSLLEVWVTKNNNSFEKEKQIMLQFPTFYKHIILDKNFLRFKKENAFSKVYRTDIIQLAVYKIVISNCIGSHRSSDGWEYDIATSIRPAIYVSNLNLNTQDALIIINFIKGNTIKNIDKGAGSCTWGGSDGNFYDSLWTEELVNLLGEKFETNESLQGKVLLEPQYLENITLFIHNSKTQHLKRLNDLEVNYQKMLKNEINHFKHELISDPRINLNSKLTDFNSYPLDIALDENNIELFYKLYKNGAWSCSNIDLLWNFVIQNGNHEVIKYFWKHYLHLFVVRDLYVLLYKSIILSNISMLSIVIDHIDINSTFIDYNHCNSTLIFNSLLIKEHHLYAINRLNCTPLSLACLHYNISIIRLLIENGANPRLIDANHKYPIEYMPRDNRNSAIMRFFE